MSDRSIDPIDAASCARATHAREVQRPQFDSIIGIRNQTSRDPIEAASCTRVAQAHSSEGAKTAFFKRRRDGRFSHRNCPFGRVAHVVFALCRNSRSLRPAPVPFWGAHFGVLGCEIRSRRSANARADQAAPSRGASEKLLRGPRLSTRTLCVWVKGVWKLSSTGGSCTVYSPR